MWYVLDDVLQYWVLGLMAKLGECDVEHSLGSLHTKFTSFAFMELLPREGEKGNAVNL